MDCHVAAQLPELSPAPLTQRLRLSPSPQSPTPGSTYLNTGRHTVIHTEITCTDLSCIDITLLAIKTMDTGSLEACAWSTIRAVQRAAGPAAAAAAHAAAARAVRELRRVAVSHPDAPVSARVWEALAQLLQAPNVHAAEAAAALVITSVQRTDSARSAPAGDDLVVGALVQAAAPPPAHGWEPDAAARTLSMAFILLLQTRDVRPCVRRAGRGTIVAVVRSAVGLLRTGDRGATATWRTARESAYRLLSQMVFLDDGGAAAAEVLDDGALLRMLGPHSPESAVLVTALASSQCCGAGRRVLQAAPELPRALAEALARGPSDPDCVLGALYDLCSVCCSPEGARALPRAGRGARG
jgi:hypothetical protein